MQKKQSTPESPRLTEAHITTKTPHPEGELGENSKLPHERDQSVPAANPKTQPEIRQAHEDLRKGLKDTDARGKDGMPLGSKRPAG